MSYSVLLVCGRAEVGLLVYLRSIAPTCTCHMRELLVLMRPTRYFVGPEVGWAVARAQCPPMLIRDYATV